MAPVLVLPLARPTFDVPFAEEMAAQAFAALDAAGVATTGPRGLLFDADAARAAIADIVPAEVSGVLLLQTTFTDASMTVEIARRFCEGAAAPRLMIWAVPEPRAGGRLRLNAFCGLNLAAHALGRAGFPHGWLYAAPDEPGTTDALQALVAGRATAPGPAAPFSAGPASPTDEARARAAAAELAALRIGLVGEHPAGFDTCRYEPEALQALAGARVERFALPDLFAAAKAADGGAVASLRAEVGARLEGVDALDQDQLDRSLRVHAALKDLAQARGCGAMAVRCWPEMFTEYGCAACGPMAMLNQEGVPAACEADIYGALTAYALQAIAGEPSWLVDIVDIDTADETAVFWHCGLAPLSMCDPQVQPQAQIHSNRRMPLLQQFTLKPGTVTIARLSQQRNATSLYLTEAEVIRAPMSFTGTSGVVRFAGRAARFRDTLLGEALEHHVAIVYGSHSAALARLGHTLGIPVKDLA